MLLFLDTEYTGLHHNNPKLISLALVYEDGQREWYGEIAEHWSIQECNAFVKKNVIPLLSGPLMTVTEARTSLHAWMATAPRHCVVACDAERDFQFLLEVMGTRPSNLAPQRYDLAPLIDSPAYHRAVERYHAQPGSPWHHALHDARSYRLGWLATQVKTS